MPNDKMQLAANSIQKSLKVDPQAKLNAIAQAYQQAQSGAMQSGMMPAAMKYPDKAPAPAAAPGLEHSDIDPSMMGPTSAEDAVDAAQGMARAPMAAAPPAGMSAEMLAKSGKLTPEMLSKMVSQ